MSATVDVSATALRARFLEYFRARGHTMVPSSGLVPLHDPTLLFANAGMNQFKDVFTGRERRPYVRAATVQKCVRAGGKHNDLENVGRTPRHHTFFEMLGNFSFGDYFKSEAIRFAWELLTHELGVDGERLTVTVFGGDTALGLAGDEEAAALWHEIAGLPEARIVRLGSKDNFWQMGETGPCGPCSEVHFHQGDDFPCGEPMCRGAACDCDRWLEVWNLVFMQFDRQPGGQLLPLPSPSVDTGMGLERLSAVLQDVRSNYETDLFVPILREISAITGRAFDPTDFEGPSVAMRAIADHARATAFLIADGVVPEKTGREYVLRRIMRRAIYHGWLLGLQEGFFDRVVDVVVDGMGGAYPELVERRATIQELTRLEEVRFRETLERGVRMLEEELVALAPPRLVLPGEVAFRLYDTFGFPLDLTEVIAHSRGLSVDAAGYEVAMDEQRRRSTFAGSGEEAVEAAYLAARADLGPTEFLGYEAMEADAKVLRVFAGGKLVEVAPQGSVVFVCDRTPFYGEQGGQVGDAGVVTAEGDLGIRVTDTRRPGGDFIVHVGEVTSGQLRSGQTVHLRVDAERREVIRKNHSATHLLHWALRSVLGEHVAQKGSVVAPERLRFDFSHVRPMSREELARVESLVNERIWRNGDVRTEVMGLDQARNSGALAFFGEKYGDRVRVVEIGESREFCGGTHVSRTGDIGLFKIVDESGIAQGTRRIAAVTGPAALDYVRRLERIVEEVAERLKANPAELIEKLDRLREEVRSQQRQIEEGQRRLASGGARDLMAEVRDVGGVRVLAARTETADLRSLRTLGDELRGKMGSSVLVLVGVADGKVGLMAMVTRDLTDRIQANKIVEALGALVGGRGGGRPELAQGGGDRPESVPAALERAYQVVAESLASSG